MGRVPGVSIGGLGFPAAWQEHVNWLKQEGVGSASRQLTEKGNLDEDRPSNQSLAVTMRRLLTNFDPNSPFPRQQVILARLSSEQLRAAYMICLGLLGLAIAVYCRRPGPATSPARWSHEIALVVLSTLWLSPVLWSYHPTAATPALAVVLGAAGRRTWLGWLTAVVWLAALSLLGFNLARLCGVLLWASLALGVALVVSWRLQPPDAPPPPAPAPANER